MQFFLLQLEKEKKRKERERRIPEVLYTVSEVFFCLGSSGLCRGELKVQQKAKSKKKKEKKEQCDAMFTPSLIVSSFSFSLLSCSKEQGIEFSQTTNFSHANDDDFSVEMR